MNHFETWTGNDFESHPENLDFTWAKDWPLHHLPTAWVWELDRELASGNPPFIVAWKKKYGDTMPAAEKVRVAAAILYLQADEVRDLIPNGSLPDFGGGEFYYYALKINLRRSEDKILADLKNEIKRLKHASATFEHQPRRVPSRKDYISRFRDLAIYRMSVADIPTKAQMRLWPAGMKMLASFDYSNWNHKRGVTKKRIEERLRTLYQLAELSGIGQDKNLRPKWNNNFIDLDGW